MQMVLALIVAVVVEFWSQLSSGGKALDRFRSVSWLKTYTAKIDDLIAKAGINQGYFIVLIQFVPLVIATIALYLLTGLILGYIGKFLFVTAALIYFLGNTKIDQHTSEYVIAHERSFGVLFWFALLGMPGALMYWFLVASKQQSDDPLAQSADTNAALTRLHAIAAWVPVRITGFIYALVGNFTAGFNCWLGCMRNPSMPGSELLQECGLASIDKNVVDDHTNLVTRAFIAWVVLSVLIVVFK